jgi:alkylation response protein AidB-like acyl-CoA dehydrogenase
VLKLLSGRVLTGVSELVVDLMGPDGTVLSSPYTRDQLDEGEVMRGDPVLSFVGAPGGTIAGGTTQIQMNIIGERVLGLPREPGLDPNTPWNQIPRN